MIFRIKNDRLYKIVPNNGITEDAFLEAQKNGMIKFIKVNRDSLPESTLKNVQVFYKYDDDKNIVVDNRRTMAEWTKVKHSELQHLIYDKYPQAKQGSDLADKMYYETELKASGAVDLEKTVYNVIVDVVTGTPFADALAKVDENVRQGVGQLVKTGLRIKWIQDCKLVLKEALTTLTEPTYPTFPEL